MIRYPVSITELKALITIESEHWLAKAKTRTTALKEAGAYQDGAPSWSDIKAAYMDIQHNKCAYCEIELERSKRQHDVEHYRPKNPVKKWPTAKIAKERKIDYGFEVGEAWGEGYFLLAYQILNYVTACKACNSDYKSNYFPIAGERGPQSDNPKDLRDEKPFLIYPLGNIDTDPEKLITFLGIIPVPVGKSGHKRRRAQVTIDFFDLGGREILRRQRARQLNSLGLALFVLEHAPTENEGAEDTIKDLTADSSPHANCMRSFLALYRDPETRAKAKEILVGVREYLKSLNPDNT